MRVHVCPFVLHAILDPFNRVDPPAIHILPLDETDLHSPNIVFDINSHVDPLGLHARVLDPLPPATHIEPFHAIA